MNERNPTDVDTRQSIRDTADDDTVRAENVRDERAGAQDRTDDDTGFLPDDRMSALRDRWSEVQGEFVDDPRSAVEKAQRLVDDLVKELTDTFARERSSLEGKWSGGGAADTEELRVALQRYRSLFNRLLST